MVLEEIAVPAALRIKQVDLLELIAAFRTARLGQAAEVVEAEGALDVFGDRAPVDCDGRR